jgi:hypothetical protein
MNYFDSSLKKRFKTTLKNLNAQAAAVCAAAAVSWLINGYHRAKLSHSQIVADIRFSSND